MPREWVRKKRCSVKCILNYSGAYMIFAGVLIMLQVYRLYGFFPAVYIGFMSSLAAILFVSAALGVASTLSENLFVTKVYAIIMLIGIILQVIGLCIPHKFEELVRESARNTIEKQWHEELVHPGAMDNLQTEFKCCGNDSSRDYIDILHRAEIPSSCYTSNVTDTTLNTEGCFTGAEEAINISYGVASRVAPFGVIINSVLFGVAVYFVIKLTNKKRRDNCQT